MQPGEIGPKAGFGFGRVAQEAAEHPVVVALQHHPVLPFGNALRQKVDDPAAVRPAVDKIAHMHYRGGPVGCHVRRDQRMDALEQAKVAVDVADGIGAHVGGLRGVERPGALPPDPRDI